ncbi:MAG: hypothetical protein ACXWUP_02020 [Allosphingosinicella sp.]
MRFKTLAMLAAASLITASTAASAQVGAPQAVERTGAATTGASQLDDDDDDGGIIIWIVGAVVLGLLIWGIIELTEDDDEAPISP